MSRNKTKTAPVVIKTDGVDEVRKVAQGIGDTLATHYYATFDLKVAQTSLKAYNTAINAAKTQLIYKKLTGEPARIPFLQ